MRFFYKLIIPTVSLMLAAALTLGAAAEGTVSAENTEDLYEPLAPEGAVAASAGDITLTSRSAILIEQTGGKILFESNAHEKLKPASVTKIMSLLLIMEAIDRGDLSLSDRITASETAASMGGSQIWLRQGEVMTVNDLLKATVIASANDATVALAEAVAGTESTFVSMMNDKAALLGMNDTHFCNCTGLDAEGHLTSAYDIAVMSAELLRHELITDYSTVWMDTLRDGKSELVNTNKLVRFYEGTTGLKTGTTSGAGYCLSASATRDGLSLIAVIMDAPSSAVRFGEARSLLSYGFANYVFLNMPIPNSELYDIPVDKGTAKSVGVCAAGEARVLVPKKDKDEVGLVFERAERLTAPVEKGAQVGICRVMCNGEELGTVKLCAENGVERMTFGKAFLLLLRQMAVI